MNNDEVISLRNYFAAMSIKSVIERFDKLPFEEDSNTHDYKNVAKEAYLIADSMLAERASNKFLANDTTITPISAQLFSFYIAYYSWLKNGAKLGGVFVREKGLCNNLGCFFKAFNVDSELYIDELRAAFIAENLDSKFPFNENSLHYFNESLHGKCHLNSDRIEWVERQIAKHI